jgi:hypothetical protein
MPDETSRGQGVLSDTIPPRAVREHLQLMLAAVFVVSVIDSIDPANGSGAEIGGVGLVFILAVGLLLPGVVLMLVWRWRNPAFFRGETLRHDIPALIVPE